MKRFTITSLEEDFKKMGIVPLEEGPRSDAVKARRLQRQFDASEFKQKAAERQAKLTGKSGKAPSADDLRARFGISKGSGRVPPPIPAKKEKEGSGKAAFSDAEDRSRIKGRQRKAYVDAGFSKEQHSKGKEYAAKLKGEPGSALSRILAHKKKETVSSRLKAKAKSLGSKVKGFFKKSK